MSEVERRGPIRQVEFAVGPHQEIREFFGLKPAQQSGPGQSPVPGDIYRNCAVKDAERVSIRLLSSDRAASACRSMACRRTPAP